MPNFNFSDAELLTFFAVLVRFSILIAVLPITGDRFIPAPAKVLLALSVTVALFPALVRTGQVNVQDAWLWGATTGGIATTVGVEVITGLIMGYTAKLAFDAVAFGSNLIGNFMGFAMASTYDPHQEAQTEVIGAFQTALATLVFLALDGHHLMLKSVLESYQTVGLGQAQFGAATATKLVELTGAVVRFGIQLAAPVAIAIFAINVAFGVMAKAVPQLNVLVLSLSVTAIAGLCVMFLNLGEFQGAVGELFGRSSDWMEGMKRALASR